MPVPDETYFGNRPEGGGISYGEVRKLSIEQERLILLKGRLDTILIGQIKELSKLNSDGKPIVYSPFPLCVLTLLSIETLGRVIGDIEKIKNDNPNEISKRIVTPIYQLMDKKLMQKPTKKFYEGLEQVHGIIDKKSVKRYSDVIQKYQRNTFNHGYQAKGVFIHPVDSFWILEEEKGFMVINPYMFWNRLVEVYDKVWIDILENQNIEYRQNALKYLDKLLT